MSDIDLIPRDYRMARWRRGWLRQLTLSGMAMLVAAFTLFGLLSIQVRELRAEAEELKQRRAVTDQQRSELEALDRQQQALSQQLAVLSSLRSGAPAQAMFAAIDKALADEEVWFVNWQFRRAGVMVPESQARGVETGYFIVIPEAGKGGPNQAWLVETHMTINGQARDHETLSRFVNGLNAQPGVVQVSVQRTELTRVADQSAVQFDLAVVLNSEARG